MSLCDLDEIWDYIALELCKSDAAENTVNGIMDTVEELKQFTELLKALGPVGMAVFLKQFELGEGNYTKEKHEVIAGFSEEDIEQLIMTR